MDREKGKCRAMLLVLGAAAVLFANVTASAAAVLRDIRIGEYKSSTRIVLEFDNQVHPAYFPKAEKNLLKVTLASASPGLVRRIPLENVKRIRDLEIIARKDEKLEIRFLFGIPDIQVKWFSLQNPFRIVMDVKPAHSQALVIPVETEKNPPVLNNNSPSPSGSESRLEKNKNTQTGLTSKSLSQAETLNKKVRIQHESRMVHSTDKPVNSLNATGHNDFTQEGFGRQLSERTDGINQKMPVLVSRKSSGTVQTKKFDLQFYLVAGLIFLTIIILGLLVSIVFSQNKSETRRGRLNIDELLRKQEKRLQVINAQIGEEMEKFDKI